MKTVQDNGLDWLGGEHNGEGGTREHLSEKVTFELGPSLSQWSN